MSHQPRMLYKITVLGDGGVGKTALTVQFTMSSFVETYDPTIEDCYRKQWVVDDQPCLLEVLDTAGQEEFTTLRDQWIRDGEGFIIAYSITNRNTFDRVEKIVERVYRVKEDAMHADSYGRPHGQAPRPARIPIVIVGNKRDRPQEREVAQDEGLALANGMGCGFFETSAKTNYNVEAAFKALVRSIKTVKMGGANATRETGGRGGKKRKKCVIL